MAKFSVGDRVTVIAEIPEYVNRSGKVVGYGRGSDLRVQLDGDPYPEVFGESELTLAKSLPTTATKALELRAKYKAAPSGTRFVVLWNTGDRDTCYGRRDLMDLLDETECTVEYGKVIDKDTGGKVGTVQEVS